MTHAWAGLLTRRASLGKAGYRPGLKLAAVLLVGGWWLVSGCDSGGDDRGDGGSVDGGAGEDAEASARDASTGDVYNPEIDPANFVDRVDNPFWPLVPGTTYRFEGGEETIEVTVTKDTRQILGVTCTVVRDTAMVNGEIAEDTYDWFAQDKEGNVWYFGEDTKEYKDGKVVSTEGSWEAGVDGAQPGIVMHAVQPAPGIAYRQEFYPGEAEDMAEVVSLSESVKVPYGSFDDCIQTREFTPLEPDANEYKYFCRGVGLVLEVDVASAARVELVSVTPP